MADHIRASQARLDDSKLATHEKTPLTASSGRLPERGSDGTPRRVPWSDQHQSSCTPTPVSAPSGLSDGAYDTTYGAGVDPVRALRPILVDLHDEKELRIIAQQLRLETWRGLPRVCWDHGTYFLWDPSRSANVCAVVTPSPHTLLKRVSSMCLRAKDHLRTLGGDLPEVLRPRRKSRPAAQRSGGHRRVASRKVTGDPAPTEERATQRARQRSVWDTG